MMDDNTPDKNALVPAKTRGLSTRSAGLVRRGLESILGRGSRVVNFPPDRPMGILSITDNERLLSPASACDDYGWEEFEDARGRVLVPASKAVMLRVTAEGAADLSPLARLQPDDLQALDMRASLLVDFHLMYEGRDLAAAGRLRFSEAWLNRTSTLVNDDSLRHVRSLRGLINLSLSNNAQITDAGLVHLRSLTAIRHLALSRTKITDRGLTLLGGLHELRLLHLSHTLVTDAGLKHIEPLTELQALYLTGTRVTNAGLRHLRSLGSLRMLSLSNTLVTDSGLAHLQLLKQLRQLDLGPHLSDAGLLSLQSLTALEELSVWGRRVTDAARENLDGALPNCKIRE